MNRLHPYFRVLAAALILAVAGCKPEESDPFVNPLPVNPGTDPDTPVLPETEKELPPAPGPVADNGPQQPENPHDGSSIWMEFLRASTSTVSVAWTTEEKNAACLSSCLPSSSYDGKTDVKKKYRVSIYRDEACSNLIVSWTVNPGLGSSTAKFDEDYPARFCFSGLEPSSTYYITVSNLTDGTSRNRPFAVRTADPIVSGATVKSDAKAGDIIFAESFDKILYGGDFTCFAAGYSRTDRSSMTDRAVPSGTDPDKADPKYYTVDCSTEMGLFNTAKGLVDDYGMSEWSMIAGGENMGTICGRPGFLKVGANSQHGYIITPKLGAIAGAATVDVSFKAAPYGGASYDATEKAIRVQVFEGGTVGASNVLDGYKERDHKELFLNGGRGDWYTYTVRLKNVTSESRIGFGGVGPEAQSRFNIDDIKITVADTYDLEPEGYFASGTVAYSDGYPANGVSVSDGFNVVVTDNKGKYLLPTTSDTRYIYISYPSDAKIERNEYGCPDFYKEFSPIRHTYNFILERIKPEKKFSLFAMADPQAHYEKRSPQTIADVDRFIQESVPAINAQIDYQKIPCYGVTLGDIVYSEGSRDSTPGMEIMRSHFSKINMPVFQTMGNHDFTYYSASRRLAVDSGSSTLHLKAQRKFEDVFGPINYSFNRGNVHVVCMRDVMFENTGYPSLIHGGFSDEQFRWLQQDLANVPTSKKVILCAHIPLHGQSSGENSAGVIKLLSAYTDATIFTGHTHYKRGFDSVLSVKMFEHVHSAVCGSYWWSNIEGDGCPNGYTVYTIDGTEITDEYFIGVNDHMKDRAHQMRMYRGNTKTGGSRAYFQWPHSDRTLLINIFNGDSRWLSVKVYEDGVYSGDASLMPTSTQSFDITKGQTYTVSTSSSQDWWAVGYYVGVKGRDYFVVNPHMYKYTLKSASSKVEVRATDPYGNVYSCSDLIEDGTVYPEWVKVGNH